MYVLLSGVGITLHTTYEMNVVNLNMMGFSFLLLVVSFFANSPRACLTKFAFYDYVLEKLRLPKYEIIHLKKLYIIHYKIKTNWNASITNRTQGS